MTVTALYPAALRIGGHLTSLVASGIVAGIDVTEKEKPTFGMVPFLEVVAGMRRFNVSTDAWQDWAAGGTDELARSYIGTLQAYSLAPEGDLAGNTALVGRALLKTYKPVSAKVGEIATLELDKAGNGVAGEGRLSIDGASTRTATVTGTAVQLGAVPAGKSVFASCHLSTYAGTITGVTFTLQGDNAVGFPSPVTLATSATLTGVGGAFLIAAGAVTDDWFRVVATPAGGAPSFVVAAAIAVA